MWHTYTHWSFVRGQRVSAIDDEAQEGSSYSVAGRGMVGGFKKGVFAQESNPSSLFFSLTLSLRLNASETRFTRAFVAGETCVIPFC